MFRKVFDLFELLDLGDCVFLIELDWRFIFNITQDDFDLLWRFEFILNIK